MNSIIRERVKIQGRILDLGGGDRPSYRLLLESQVTEWVTADIVPDNKPTVLCNLEQPLPFEDSEFDAVIAFNLLEHIYNHQPLIGEMYRILKPGGNCEVMVPFLINIHGDPHDYFRYTESSLNKLFKHAGFAKIDVIPLGGIFQSAFQIIHPLFKGKILNTIGGTCAIGLDNVLKNLKKSNFENRWVLMYYLTAKK
ncbi:class I SAM-dependent methyltransferase [Phormidium sp. CCY1219]|uniref:class I SAM-dependent methyltransferase n=1 Tax=Phormidium sp. CCY1219 TaxID=2886104 RepID=UPI002D1F1E93|nr:class I SAM-dependent methyltransferase [Phormidium sp. CCY1219]MEB3830092.1 class I SAM-dependent methyltransferase [Phormidium sp. CCY1219]